MKKILFFILLLSGGLVLQAAEKEKQFTKIIENYDVPDEARLIDLGDNELFWQTMIGNNASLVKFERDMKKGRGAEKEAISKCESLPRFYPQFDASVIHPLQSYCDSLLNDMGLGGMQVSLHIVHSDYRDAFTAKTENGFAVCITSALMGTHGMTDNIVKGLVAREFAHAALQHHCRSFYDAAKTRRRNDLLVGLAAVVVLAGSAALPDDDQYQLSVGDFQRDRIIRELKKARTCEHVPINSYTFNYSRGLEYEADLAAYRFMAYIGCTDALFDGLRMLGTQYDELYKNFTEKPNISERIDFMKFVRDNPGLGNKHRVK